MAAAGKIWIRTGVIAGSLLIVLAVAAYLIFHYRLKDMVEQIVLMESGYTYELKMSGLKFSYRKKSIQLKDVRLTCLKPETESPHYGAVIPELYLSIDSWQELLREKKLDIDSLYMRSPVFHIYREQALPSKSRSDKPVADVLDILHRVRKKMGIRSMHLENTSLAFHSGKNDENPFVANAIHFRVRNFSEKTDPQTGFLSAEDLSLDVGRQNWNFPNGSRLAFGRMFFSGGSQFFELDSCYYSSAEGEGKGRLSFSADKARWSSHHLPDIYTNGEVLLDTIYLARPVIDFDVPEKKDFSADSSTELSTSMSRLFGEINVKYIQVDQGRLMLESNGKKGTTYSSRSTDLVMQDLEINRDSLPHIRVGNIDLKLNEVVLSTADSQYVLSIDEFGLSDNDLICKNAVFAPTLRNTISSDFSLKLPAFVLNEISLPDVLQKKFKATSGTFINPDIQLRLRPGQAGQKRDKEERLKKLYHSLNGLAQLINVNNLAIKDANMEIFPAIEGKSASVIVDDLDADIRLNRFLESNALLNMKEAITDLDIGEINLKTSGVNVTVRELKLEGDRQKNHVNSVSLLTRGGTRLMGQDIYWQEFDWDRAMYLNKMELDSVYAKSLLMEIDPSGNKVDSFSANNDSPIALFVRKLNADEVFLFLQTKTGGNARSQITGIHLDSLTVNENDFRWKLLEARLVNPDFRRGDLILSAGSVDVKSDEKIKFRDLQWKKGNNYSEAAALTVKGNFNSLRDDHFVINELAIESPDLMISKMLKNVAVNGNEKKVINKRFTIDRLLVTNGRIDYSVPADSIHLLTGFSANGSSLSYDKDSAWSWKYDRLNIDLLDARLDSRKISAGIPLFNYKLNKGMFSMSSEAFRIRSGVELSWKGAGIVPVTLFPSRLNLSGLAGSFRNDDFSFTSGSQPDLSSLLRSVDLEDGSAVYENDKINLKIDSLRWQGRTTGLQTGRVSIIPLISRDSFFAASRWQKDFITWEFAGLRISDFNIEKLLKDSSVQMREIHLSTPVISASRDKNMPFEHGREKYMPTRLISSLSMPLKVDSVIMDNGTVNVTELSALTGREGRVVISGLDARIYDVSNQSDRSDSLRINAKGMIFGHHIQSFRYRESYRDSLSGFRMSLRMAPMDLKRLSTVTNPLASVNVERGRSDTLFTRISGNKYASYGEMNFHYRDLKIRLLDKQDTSKKNFLLSFENLVANSLVLRSKNRKSSTVFFKRDREKFIFNYWIKSVFSGVMTGAGVKSNKKFEKEYKAVKDSYSLPGTKE